VNQEQQVAARALITGLLGDGLLPQTEPAAFAVKVSDASVAADVLGALSRARIQFTDFSLGTPSLDDVFFALTGRPAEEKAKDPEGTS
jgi:ABC-2 type transport system ATP-binding protein